MKQKQIVNVSLSLITYVIAFLMFFPILWMVMTSFKTEAIAFDYPPKLLFEPTLDNWRIALYESNFAHHLTNTLIITLVSTITAMLLGIPAAYSLAFFPGKRSDFTLMWMISTRMLPPAGVIVPLYVLALDLKLLDTHAGLVLVYTAMNVPLVVWMMRSFFLDLPYEIIEAGRIDGVSLLQELRYIILPLVMPGLTATFLLCLIFAWNEFFFAFNLTTSDASPLSVYISSFKTSEGLFWAKMSAGATIAVLPVVLAGWVAQRQLVTGLTAGAVKA
jgi:sorbitol/mannitol transport system permease protein